MTPKTISSLISSVFVALTLSAACAAHAETLDSTFASARAYNPQLQSAAFGTAAADARVAQAKAAFMPTVTATGSYGMNRYDALGVAPISNMHPLTGGISLTLPLYTGGRLTAQLAAARAQGQESQYQQSLTEQSVLFSAGNAFLKVARADKALQLAKSQQALLERELTQAQAELTAGVRTKTDVAQAQARLAGAKALVRDSEATLNTARFDYQAVTGRMPEGELMTVDSPEPVNMSSFLADVRARSPQALATRAAVEAATAGIDVAKAAYRPTLSLNAGLSHDRETNPFLARETNRTIGVELRIPLYTGGMAKAVTAEATAKLFQARADAEYVDSTLQSEASSAWEMLSSDNSQIDARMQQVDAAKTAVEGARMEHKVGTRTLLDVLNAEQEQLDAQLDLLNAQFDRTSVLLRLQALAGRLGAA